MSKNFSSRLQSLMDAKFITQTDLARTMRTSQSTVLRWLSGSVPRSRMLSDLAHALDTTPVWLAEGRGIKSFPAEEAAQSQRIAETTSEDKFDAELHSLTMPELIKFARLLALTDLSARDLIQRIFRRMEALDNSSP